MELNKFKINEKSTIRECLKKLEENHHGLIITINDENAVTGVMTDGDLRRELLNGALLTDQVSRIVNRRFVYADANTPREAILKLLDNRIKVIPVLGKYRELVDVIHKEHFPLSEESITYARARAPVRISFAGGGSDTTQYFSDKNDGAVINATITIYSHATLILRKDEKIIINSLDLGEALIVDNLVQALEPNPKFRLIQAILSLIKPQSGFELYLHSEFPMNTGLGGSAVITAAILGCFNQFRRDKWDQHELAELAFQAERLSLGISGGWQDQYATVFGGFNFIEFRMDQNIVHPLRIHPDTLHELEASLVLCDTGTTHDSSDIHQDQSQQMRADQGRDLVRANVKLCYEMRNELLRGRLLQFGRSMDQAWHFKRQFSDKISTKTLDEIYSGALANGAVGGKLLGAGGGGFFLFYALPFRKHELISHLENAGLKIRHFRFESQGLQAWTVRESRNHFECEIQ